MSHRRDDRVVSLLPRPPLAGDVGARLPYTLTHLCISASLHLCMDLRICICTTNQLGTKCNAGWNWTVFVSLIDTFEIQVGKVHEQIVVCNAGLYCMEDRCLLPTATDVPS